MPCPDDDTVLAFLDRRLDPPRMQALEVHLDRCSACRKVVGALADELATPTAPETRAPPTQGLLWSGDRVDAFEIEALIGRGGMGDVYAARDTQLRRRVAIKLITASLDASPEAHARILVEARAMARLSHPHIAAIHSAGEHHGRPYLALEYLEGETLRHRLDRGPLSLPEALAVGCAIASALAEAHRHMVLHRDLKPQNVMLARDGRARVLDFGLAKLRPSALDPRGESLFETDEPGVRGTPAYIAPEQWRGEVAGEPADVWALGVILYELVSGKRPYQETSAISYAVRVADAQPVPPPPALPGTPEALVAVIERCLSKSPAARPTADQLATLLGELEGAEPVRVALELERAAERWESRGEKPAELWAGAALTRAERVLAQGAVPLAISAMRFLSASTSRARAASRRRVLALSVLGSAAALSALIAAGAAVQSARERARAEAREAEAIRERAAALVEGAAASLARGAHHEARAKLRAGLELEDSAAGRALWGALEREPLTWSRSLGSGVFDVAFAPRTGLIAAGAQDHTVYLIDPRTLAVRSLRGHTDQVYQVAFSIDGTWLASASWSGEVRLWAVGSGGVRVLRPPGPRVAAMVFDGPGTELIVAELDGPIRALRVDGSGERLLPGTKARDLALEVRGGSEALWAAHADGHLRTYDLATGAARLDVAVSSSPLTSVSTGLGRVAVGGEDGVVRVLGGSGEVQATHPGHQAKVVRVRWADRHRLVSIAEDKTARLWPSGRVIGGRDAALWGLAADGEWAVIGGVDGVLRRWDLARVEDSPDGASHTDGATSVAFGDHLLYSGGYDRAIRRWDLLEGRPRGALLGHTGTVYGLSRHGSTLASASHDGTVRLWDLERDVTTHVLSGHERGVYAVAIDPSGTQVVSGGSDGTVRWWSRASGRAGRVAREHGAPVFALAWSPTGDRVASAGAGPAILIHDARGRGPLRLTGHQGNVWGLAWSPDGRTLASASFDKTVRLWDPGGGARAHRVLAKLDARAYGLAFTPDGAELVVASADGRAHLIDVATGERRALTGHRAEVNQVRVSADGKWIASASDDGTVRVWDRASGWPAWRDRALHPRVWASDRRGRWTCLATLEGPLELHEEGARRFSVALDAPLTSAQLRATDGGCAVIGASGVARLYDATGLARDLTPGAAAIEPGADGSVWVVAGDRLQHYDARAQRLSERPIDRGVTAVVPLEDADGRAERWALGFENGRVELVGAGVAMESTPGGPVQRLALGPRGTLLAGWVSGEVGLWRLDNGARLDGARLHGPIAELSGEGGTWVATSELGGRLRPSDVFARDRCALLRRVWDEVPVTWRDGLPVVAPRPETHPCATP